MVALFGCWLCSLFELLVAGVCSAWLLGIALFVFMLVALGSLRVVCYLGLLD